MKTIYKLSARVALVILLTLTMSQFAMAQLKIGDNPTTINRSSILELESSRQGLLLPRLTDTTLINALNPPDGMIIYLTTDNSLRLRSNGSWTKIADLAMSSSNWALNGNSGTDSTINFIGTADGKPLVFKTNNTDRLHINAAGNIGIGTANPTAKLDVNGSVKFESILVDTNIVTMLVLANDGSVYKRDIPATVFHNAIASINNLQFSSLSLNAGSNLSVDSVTIVNRSSDSTIVINLPVQDGASGSNKPYGFLTYGDWEKIQNAVQRVVIGAVASSPDANGASIDSTANTRTIILHAADATHPGIMTADSQTFGGNKTFAGNVNVNGEMNLNNVSTNLTTDTVLVISNGTVNKRVVSTSAFGKSIQNINGNRDTVQTFAIGNVGADLSIISNGSDSIIVNIPDAGGSSRGVVTTASQTFAGKKAFSDSLSVAQTLLAGSIGSANSTLQVSGSLSLAITTVAANYTITQSDNTILGNTTAAAVTLTLPDPANISGRIYTIKKIGTGGIDNQLTILPASGNIEGGVSYNIYNDWTCIAVQTDGLNWYIIRK